ncbi:McrB family protein [Sporolactobacillus terrae]|uniref:McrB family protein n=1 Tax=Sporolactobacillus terrae TaxID=269673 RepID=UPI00048CBCE8|nr:AAA family ATPase [Sporolactobacillus terrae]
MNSTFESADILGVMAKEDDIQSILGKQSIFVNKNNVLQFYIRIISQTPASLSPDVIYVNAFCDNEFTEQWGFEDDEYGDRFERVHNLREFLKKSLLIFNIVRYQSDKQDYYNARKVRMIAAQPGFSEKDTFYPIPIFSEKTHKIDYSTFENYLYYKKYVGEISNLSNDSEDTPTYVLWKDSDDNYIVFGQFEKHSHAMGGFRFSYKYKLCKMVMKSNWLAESYFKEVQNLAFISLRISEEIDKAFGKGEFHEISGKNSDESEYRENETTSKQGSNVNETEFIQKFVDQTRQLGLHYAPKDLINFHTAMKTSNLVILSGMSGTGKSKLVNAYMKTIGLNSDSKQYTFIPVSPSWADDSDLLGYADTLNMVYRPGDSGLIDALISAEKNKDKIYIICFDEMNLAKVEHYFSKFLSILELDVLQRKLQLYNESISAKLYNSIQYPSSIDIGDNVRFVGTVNIDESTHHFSNKVLDRANVIELEVLNFSQLFNQYSYNDMKHSDKKVDYSKEYLEFIGNTSNSGLTESQLDLLWKIHVAMNSVDNQMGVSPRIVKQINEYLNNLPDNDYLTYQEAFDLQIVQRVFTKLRGSEDELNSLLGNYSNNKSIEETTDGELMKKLEEFTEYDLRHSKDTILKKAKEIHLYGYTL